MFTRLSTFFSSLSATKQFFFARTFYDWAIFVFDTFYLTYIFKESGDVRQVVYNILITYLTVLVGFVFGSFMMRRLGVEKNLRLSFVLYILTGLLAIYLVQLNIVSFLLISLVRGFAEGVFWASVNIIELTGLPHNSRSRFYSISHGVDEIFFIVAPITLGVLLTRADSLMPSFIIFAAICFVALFLPFKFNLKKEITIKWENFQKIFRKKALPRYVIIKSLLSGIWITDWFLASLIPFIILGSELDMGIFLTVSALLGVIISLVTNKLSVIKKSKIGWPLIIASGAANLLLVFWFTPVMLYVNSIILAIAASITQPLEMDLATRITNEMDNTNELGVEMNLFQEALYTIVRVIFCGFVLVAIAYGIQTLVLLKVFLAIIITFKLANYLLSVKFLKINY